MENKQSVQVNSGSCFVSLLTLLFIALKLTGYIDWSWWWVFSPMLISLGIGVFILVIALIVFIITKGK